MPDRSPPAPRSAYLLRVQREQRIRLRFELHDLRSGAVWRFDTLAALTRFLREPGAAAPHPGRAKRK